MVCINRDYFIPPSEPAAAEKPGTPQSPLAPSPEMVEVWDPQEGHPVVIPSCQFDNFGNGIHPHAMFCWYEEEREYEADEYQEDEYQEDQDQEDQYQEDEYQEDEYRDDGYREEGYGEEYDEEYGEEE